MAGEVTTVKRTNYRGKRKAADIARNHELYLRALNQWTDEQGHEHRLCHLCNADCSTHPDAGNPLEFCGDCGKPTCPDHRVDDAAARCNACAAVFYQEAGNGQS